MFVKASVAQTYPKVTYLSTYGGVGVGYLIDGKVYVSGGNGLYYEKEVASYKEDDGRGYINRIREMGDRI